MMIDPIYSRIEDTPRPTVIAACGLVCLAALGQWASMLIGVLLGSANLVLLDALYYLPFYLLPMLLYARRHPGLSGALRLNPLPVLPVLTLALLAILSAYVAGALAGIWAAGLDALGFRMTDSLPTPENGRELALSMITMAAVPALFEELVFRGFVLSAWESRGTAFAIGVTSVLFALLHGNVYGLPAYLLIGAVAGYATCALDTVYAGIVYHMIYNAVCVLIPYLLTRYVNAPSADELGGSALFVYALQAINFGGLMVPLLLSLRRRSRRAGIAFIPRIRRPLTTREKLMLLAALLPMIATSVIVLLMAR